MQQLTFDPPEKNPGRLVLNLKVQGRLPSWNEVLGMEHWARHKLKSDIQADFLSALQASASGSLTKTTSAKSITWTAAVTLVCHQPMKVQVPEQPGEDCPIEWLDIFAKWLTCEECLIRLKRAVREPVRQPALPLPEPPEPRQSEPRQVKEVGLPYKDE